MSELRGHEVNLSKLRTELQLETMGITHCKSVACLIIHDDSMKKGYINFCFPSFQKLTQINTTSANFPPSPFVG